MSEQMGQVIEVKQDIAVQLSFIEPAETVRPDINIAKWAGYLFSSPWAKDLHEEKKIKFTLSDGSSGSICIIPAVGRKRPTTTTQKIFYAAIQLWEEAGKPRTGRFLFSARQICAVADLKWSGKKSAKMIQEHLSILNTTSVDWTRSFHYNGELTTKTEEMSLIDAKSYLTRESMENREFFYAQHTMRLNQDLVDNMLAGKTKPINFRAFISIKHDGAIKLYNFLDNFMASKNYWERRAEALIREELELEGKRYKEKRIRLAKLKELVAALDGKELSSGVISLAIKDTSDKVDYKLCVSKKSKKATPRIPHKIANEREQIPAIIDGVFSNLEKAGTVDRAESKKTIERLALWYPADMLYGMSSLVKLDYKGNINTSVIKTFMYLVHLEAHQRGLEWIKDCGKNCRYRPENSQAPEFFTSSPVEEIPAVKKTKKKAKKLEKKQKKKNQVSNKTPSSFTEKLYEAASASQNKEFLNPIEADKKIKNDFLDTLSESEKNEALLLAKQTHPELADMITTLSEGTGFAALRSVIPGFQEELKKLTGEGSDKE